MAETPQRRRVPRFNHVAFSVDPELLTGPGRKELVDFYGEVFGWTEIPQLTRDRERLVFQCHRVDQFVFITAADRPTRSAPGDHFGLSVGTLDELRGVLERARRYRERDDRVEIEDYKVEDHGVLKLHNGYVRFRLPLMVEVQHYEWTGPAPGA